MVSCIELGGLRCNTLQSKMVDSKDPVHCCEILSVTLVSVSASYNVPPYKHMPDCLF